MSRREYICYDGRACRFDGGSGKTDRATIMDIAATLELALGSAIGQCAIYSYADDGESLTDERWECDCMDGRITHRRRG